MSETDAAIAEICERFGNDRTRLMDIVAAVQADRGGVDGSALDAIASAVGVPRVEVESLVTFYAFFSDRPKGGIVIRLCDDIIDEMFGAGKVERAFREALEIGIGETTPDGRITLERAPCIGLCDQAPAALINDVPVTYLSGDRAREMVAELKQHGDPRKLVHRLGDGNNAHPRVRSMVHNGIRKRGAVIFAEMERGAALRRALAMSPVEVIRDIKTSRLRGRGGAGFPTGMKWDFTRAAEADRKFVFCNADEGEPGTFKDRVILTECPDLLFEGMTIAGYAIGATEGIVYLRGEYAYLREFLEEVLEQRRKDGLLGKSLPGRPEAAFDIRIQMGAGAYICGEETALISSCEGLRGDPKNRPPFPAQRGYLGFPTCVNNVETLCCAARILEKGPGWFAELGSKGSPGTKLLSVSGDCSIPGVYEVPFGIRLDALLEMVGAPNAAAVQVGGPSGRLVGPDEFKRMICYDHLATGGSVMVFGPQRDLLHVVERFMDFFVEESCGYCTPCRVGNVLLRQKVADFRAGRGAASDFAWIEELGDTMKTASRCGLGQTSANPVLSSLQAFRDLYESRLGPDRGDAFLPAFDIRGALAESERLAGRASVVYTGGEGEG